VRYSLPFSFLFHVAVLLAAMIGWPSASRPLADHKDESTIEVVRLDELPNPAPGRPLKPEEKPAEDDESTTRSRTAPPPRP
jgi:hypothetical protein